MKYFSARGTKQKQKEIEENIVVRTVFSPSKEDFTAVQRRQKKMPNIYVPWYECGNSAITQHMKKEHTKGFRWNSLLCRLLVCFPSSPSSSSQRHFEVWETERITLRLCPLKAALTAVFRHLALYTQTPTWMQQPKAAQTQLMCLMNR